MRVGYKREVAIEEIQLVSLMRSKGPSGIRRGFGSMGSVSSLSREDKIR